MAARRNSISRKKLGIVGGMGPLATAELFKRVVQFTAVDHDQDHLEVMLLNAPTIPDRTAFLLNRPGAEDFRPVLRGMITRLTEAGCEVLAMPCNTAHAYIAELEEGTTGSFVDMPRESVRLAARLGACNIGILATDGSIAGRVYQRVLEEEGLGHCEPGKTDQRQVMAVIYEGVKAGRVCSFGEVASVIDHLIDEKGCDGVILACTELSMMVDIPAFYRGCAVIDALSVLAWQCVCACGAPDVSYEAAFSSQGSA